MAVNTKTPTWLATLHAADAAGKTVVSQSPNYKKNNSNNNGIYKGTYNGNGTTTYNMSGGTSGGYTGGSSGGTTNYKPGDYTINTAAGYQQAHNMAIGSTWYNPGDGSKWVKENDGTITVYDNGTESKNAYRPSDYQQMVNYRRNQNFINQNQNQQWFDQNQPTYDDKYYAQIDAQLNKILNRDGFSYDYKSDPLFQQYAETYQREGDRAMSNTLAEVAASAGGMNSYAITAAQQANNYYNAQLGDKIPELYQLAYEMYLQDMNNEIQKMGLLQDMSDSQYSRYLDTMDRYYKDKDFAYNLYRDNVRDSQWQTEFDYNASIDDRNFNWQVSDAYKNDARYDDEIAYEREQQKREDAQNLVLTMIEGGASFESIDPALIAAAGFTDASVRDMIAKEANGNFSKASSGNGGGNPGKYVIEENDGTENYTLINKSGDDWINIPGAGRFTPQEVDTLVEKGDVEEIIDKEKQTIEYKTKKIFRNNGVR